MKKPCKISASTMARTAALALALTNQLLSCTGHSVLPIESPEAIEADQYLTRLKQK